MTTILLLDPDHARRGAVKAMLRSARHAVTCCAAFADALRAARDVQPRIVVMSLDGLPDRAIRTLKAAFGAKVPLVMGIATAATPDGGLYAFEDGADDLITAPVDQVELLARLRRLTRRVTEFSAEFPGFTLREAATEFVMPKRLLLIGPGGLPASSATAANFRLAPNEVAVLHGMQAPVETLRILKTVHPALPCIVQLPARDGALTANLLDAGASDVTIGAGITQDLRLRAAALPVTEQLAAA